MKMPKYQPYEFTLQSMFVACVLVFCSAMLNQFTVSCNSCLILCVIGVILHLNFCTPLLKLIEVTVQYILFASVKCLIGFTGNHIFVYLYSVWSVLLSVIFRLSWYSI
jgi:hypothetical protein